MVQIIKHKKRVNIVCIALLLEVRLNMHKTGELT